MLKLLKHNIHKDLNNNKLLFLLVIIALVSACSTYYVISAPPTISGPDPSKVIGFILGDLIIFLILGIVLARKFLQNIVGNDTKQSYPKLQNRIIIAFSLVATIPTIIVSVFSAYFFNFGIQAWFDKKISAVLDQSIIVAESYIAEHKVQLKETALSVANDLGELYYELIHNPALFTETLNAEATMRALDEAIVLHRPTNTVIANTFLSFAISFATIPEHLIRKADMGEIVEVKSDPMKIRMLIKLREHNDTYLLVGRLIDPKIIDHIDQTNGAAGEYYRLKKHISNMQIKFSIAFIFIALLLLLAAISWGMVFATKIVNPIKRLVLATEKVKKGDFTVQVPEDLLNKDEISVLSTAFNRMIKQIDRQQNELVIAQRALAWSDVARKVAHEIKNPLTPINLASERLLRKFGEQVNDKIEFNKYIQMIMRHTNDIQKIVSEFVHFARLPAPIFDNCDLVVLVKNMVESRKLINDKISYSFTTTHPYIEFICDTTQVNQIMVNLLKNAEESIGRIENGKGNIKVAITSTIHSVTITVADNGIGFPSHLIATATESYVTTSANGMGLGLAIVKKIAQEHCATIEIKNQVLGGAVVEISFNMEELSSKVRRG